VGDDNLLQLQEEKDRECDHLRKENIEKEVTIQTLQKTTEQTSSSVSQQLEELTKGYFTTNCTQLPLTRAILWQNI